MAWWLQHWLLFQGTKLKRLLTTICYSDSSLVHRESSRTVSITQKPYLNTPPPKKKALAALLEDVGLIFSTTRWLTILSNSSPQRL